jgi:hypothetical protein
VVGRRREIERCGGRVLLVAYDEEDVLWQKMAHGLEIPYPLLVDREKAAYRKWGMGRLPVGEAFRSLGSLTLRYAKLLLRGERFLGFAKDMRQLGGDFIIDPSGLVGFAHAMRNNGDRAPVDRLLEALRRAAEASRPSE